VIKSKDRAYKPSCGKKDGRAWYDGNSAILVEGTRLISAYSSEYFDDGIKRIIEEVRKYG